MAHVHSPTEVIFVLGPYGSMPVTNSHASRAWPTANAAIYQWLTIPKPLTVTRLWVVNGGTVSGNFDLGLYDHTGRRLAHTGSTAQAGTHTRQSVALGSPLVVGSGSFLIALAFDNTTAQVWTVANGNNALYMSGAQAQATAFPLPDPATLSGLGTNYSPFCGLSCRGF